ncbi:MAG: type II methionyl aminopeptidase [Nitrososphaerales archaeon]
MLLIEEQIKAGKITSEVRNEVIKKVSVGMRLLDLCEFVERMIEEKGGEPAFPCNVCLNHIAAHYTPSIDDESVIHDGDVVKIDIGVHIKGYIADTAITISFNPKFDSMVQAVNEVLKEVIKVVKAGTRVGELGRIVEEGARKRGFKPISNLSGHSIEPYKIHGGLSIPNVWVPSTSELKAGSIYAIEPFLTTIDGAGLVINGNITNIYSLITRKRTQDKDLDELINIIWSKWKTLPFTPRYFKDVIKKKSLDMMLNKLVKLKILRAYPILVEANGKCVVQAEHTIMPTDNGVIILTQ